MVKRENDRGPIFHYGMPSGTHGFRFWIVEYYDSGSVYANSPNWTTKPHTHIDSNKWYYVGISYDYYSGVAKIWVNGRATSEVRKWRQHVSYLHSNARFRYKSVSVVLLLGIADN